jgi:hypothetical protein
MSLSADRHKRLSSRRTTYPGILPPKRTATPLGHATSAPAILLVA